MSGNGLGSVPGLRDNHRKALAGIGVTTLRALAHADPKLLRDALRPTRVKRATVDGWQTYARNATGRAPSAAGQAAAASEWEDIASYAVIFEQRAGPGEVERRITVARTELEPEEETTSIPGWSSTALGAWFGSRFPMVDSPAAPVTGSDADEATADEAPPAPLQIESVRLIEGDESTGVYPAEGDDPPVIACTKEGRIEVAVRGTAPDEEIRVALQIRRTDDNAEEGRPRLWHAAAVEACVDGRATLALSRIGAGRREGKLVAWTPGGTARSRTLRPLDIVRA
jgi:hypothetical protein